MERRTEAPALPAILAKMRGDGKLERAPIHDDALRCCPSCEFGHTALQALALNNLSLTSVDLTEIRKIVKLMDEHGLSQFQFEKEDFKLKLKKGTDLEDLQGLMRALPSAPSATPAAAPAPSSPAQPADAGAAPAAKEGEEILSPMVGTFYRKASPESPDFVNVGDTISEGQTLCIIEAMKVMNEIKAERSGTITEICVDDANPVQYGDALFRVK